ncbi:MAG: hypothetical protein QXF01_01480 [Candidatus Micrarchaeaceae archaeon]
MKFLKAILVMLAMALFASAIYAGTGGPSPVPPPPGYNLTVNATVLCKGETNYVPVTIANHGTGQIGSMQYTLLGLSPTKGLLASAIDVGTVPPNSTRTYMFPIFVDSNASLYIPAGITINYYYYSIYTNSEVSNVSFTTRDCVQPISAYFSPRIITSGAIDNLTINVTNAGTLQLRNLSIYINVPSADAAVLGTNPIIINSIAPHSSVLLSQSLYVSRNASQDFQANLTIDYYNGTSLSQFSNSTQLLTVGIINITSSGLTLSPPVPSPGSIFSISLVLTNTGTSAASAVAASAAQTQGFSSYGSNSVFVGSIGADSQVPVTLTLVASPSLRSGLYKVPIRINYLNSLRQNISEEIPVSVQLAAANAFNATYQNAQKYHASGGGFIVIILLVIIVVLLALYYRERKKNARHVK